MKTATAKGPAMHVTTRQRATLMVEDTYLRPVLTSSLCGSCIPPCPCAICLPRISFLPTSSKCFYSPLHKSISAHHSIRIGLGILVLIQNDNKVFCFQGKNNVGLFQVSFKGQGLVGRPESTPAGGDSLPGATQTRTASGSRHLEGG